MFLAVLTQLGWLLLLLRWPLQLYGLFLTLQLLLWLLMLWLLWVTQHKQKVMLWVAVRVLP